MKAQKLILDGKSLTFEKIKYFLEQNPKIALSTEAKSKINKARNLVDKWVKTDARIRAP